MDFESFRAKLSEFNALREGEVKGEEIVKRIQPILAESWPSGIDPCLHIALRTEGHRRPYRHQHDAIVRAIQGHDVVLDSPTASGKTLAFTVPMLNALLSQPNSKALMIYPMNALSLDQFDKLRELCEPLGITVDTYVKQTGRARRREIRGNLPQILLTNPEYLNSAFLGWRERHWNEFLSNLRFLVIDEMHIYRGYFGNNMALLLRRFFLQLDRLGVSPQVFMSTATCANPVEHAKNLTERSLTLVQPNNAMRPERHFLFVKPNIGDENSWNDFRGRIEKVALAIFHQQLRVLIFCPTINFIEQAYNSCKRNVEKLGKDASALARYHAKLLDHEKLETQQRIKSGESRVIFTTNALEVGLDIGGLDGIVLAGFPSNMMSAWQQIGRAGRDFESDAFVLFYATDDPIDRSTVNDIGTFLNKELDELVVDPDNELLIQNHMESLMQETAGKIFPSDKAILGDAFYEAAKLAARSYRPRRASYKWGSKSPQMKLLDKGLRGDNAQNYDLEFEGQPIAENIPGQWRFRNAYRGAIFTWSAQRYRVIETRVSLEERKILLEKAPPRQRTEPFFYTSIKVDDTFESQDYDDFSISYGEVNLTIIFNQYKQVYEDTGDIDIMEPDEDERFFKRDRLHALWLEIYEGWDAVSIFTVLHLLRHGANSFVPADRFDTSTFPRVLDHTAVFLHETSRGGIGIVKRLLDVWPKALKVGIEKADSCACSTGCIDCIQPTKSWDSGNVAIDKTKGIALATHLLESVN